MTSQVDPSHASGSAHHGSSLWRRMRQTTGTVYGDIGTSVLYTLMEITRETVLLKNRDLPHDQVVSMIATGGPFVTDNEALGGLSLVFWALIYLSVKYDFLIMRADNRGEGGEFALWSLLKGYTGKVFGFTTLGFIVVCAVSLLAADGVITPPISMLGAFEPLGPNWAVFGTIICLFILFKVQWRGTAKVGGFFGWFMIFVWFPWIALKGIPWIFACPEVFLAVNPLYAISFLAQFPLIGSLVVLGVVVLAITGGEAKYADIGHFSRSRDSLVSEGNSIAPADSGRVPVMYSWFIIVFPCLLLCYAAQTAYIMEQGVPPRANTFYAITPRFDVDWLDRALSIADMVIAGIAAFIASQALITGMFSIVKQATVLGLIPRFHVRYTSAEEAGQVYIPAVNWSLFLGCVTITLVFQSAANLAAAYGIAVTGSMGITTIMFGSVAFYRWQWPLWKVLLVCIPILAIDFMFLFSNMLKLTSGGFYPIAIAAVLVTIMVTWQWGRNLLSRAFHEFGVREGKKIEWLVALRDMLDDLEMTLQENLMGARALIQGSRRLVESDRAVVFLCSRPILGVDDYVPVALRIFLKKYGVLPSHIVLMHVHQASVAYFEKAKRFSVIPLGHNIDSVIVNYGYMEQPDVRTALRSLQHQGRINIAADRWIIEVGEEDIIIAPKLRFLAMLRVSLFRALLWMSTPAHKYMGLIYDAAISKEVIPVVFGPDGAKIALPELEIVSLEPSATPAASARNDTSRR